MSKRISNIITIKNIEKEKKINPPPAKEYNMFSRAYSHFDCVDIIATFEEKTIGKLESITYKISSERISAFTMGSELEYQTRMRDRRSITGSIIFLEFDLEPIVHGRLIRSRYSFIDTSVQVPPFDVTIKTPHGYEVPSLMKITGVELKSDEFSASVDNIVAGHKYTYTASRLIPWTRVRS